LMQFSVTTYVAIIPDGALSFNYFNLPAGHGNGDLRRDAGKRLYGVR
jgi:hypothetical protein